MRARTRKPARGRRAADIARPVAGTWVRRSTALLAPAIAVATALWWIRPATETAAAADRTPVAVPAPVGARTAPASAAVASTAITAPASVAPPEAAAAEPPVGTTELPTASPIESRGDTMFLTIIGDQTFVTWGNAGDRPPRFDVVPGSTTLVAASTREPRAPSAGGGRVIDDPAAAVLQAEASNPDFRPLGPAPQSCPRTLPPGSDQATAEALRSQFGCRYLSSCSSESECSWHYQGRG